MKIKSILPHLSLMMFASCCKVISNNDLNHEGNKHDQKKEVIKGDLLVMKDKGVVCNKLKVGKNTCLDHQLSFNNKGCNPLFAKGTQEQNLLNLRATLCLACNPGLSCSLNNNCVTTGEPAVGCLDLASSFCQNRVKVCSGEGIAGNNASISVSGSSCLSQRGIFSAFVPLNSISVTTNVQVELCIPLQFCIPFCDRPTLQATYDDGSGILTRTACVKDTFIGTAPNLPQCSLDGHSVTTFLRAQINVFNISNSKACIKFTLYYQNCIGIRARVSQGVSCLAPLQEQACNAQKTAIEDICKHANILLSTACFDINTEGRVL